LFPGAKEIAVNKRLLVLGATLALFFALAALFRMIVGEDLARDKSVQKVPQADVREGLDIRLVSERTPFMRSER
jgi:hypothetical protein